MAFVFWVPPLVFVPAALIAFPTSVALKHATPGIVARYRMAIVAALTLSGTITVHLLTLDGLPGITYGLLLGDDTEYSQGYSAHRFRGVGVGMTEQQVRSLLGPPLDTWTVDKTARVSWRWSRSRHGSHYRVRVVTFNNGVVVDKHASFYVD